MGWQGVIVLILFVASCLYLGKSMLIRRRATRAPGGCSCCHTSCPAGRKPDAHCGK